MSHYIVLWALQAKSKREIVKSNVNREKCVNSYLISRLRRELILLYTILIE